jgi:hypothetical protein
MRRRLVGLCTALAVVLAGSASAAVTAKLSATSHAPMVGDTWRWTVAVANGGAPAAAKARVQLLAFGMVVGCLKNDEMRPCTGANAGDLLSFFGRKAGTIRWTKQSRGVPLTFQVVLAIDGKTTKLRYAVTVR